MRRQPAQAEERQERGFSSHFLIHLQSVATNSDHKCATMMPRVRGQRDAERPDWTRTYAPRTLSEVLGKCHTPDGLARTQGAKFNSP